MRLNEEQLLWWEKARARGVVHFVLVRGVLGYGVGGALVWTSGMQLFNYDVTSVLPLVFVLWPIGGFLLFLVQWHRFNRAYPTQR